MGKEESKCLQISCFMLQKKSLKHLAIDSKDVIVPLLVCNCKHDDKCRFDGKNGFISDHMSSERLVH